MTKNIFIILIIFTFSKAALACNISDSSFDQDEVSNWLGNKSLFSKSYKEGKCVLDEALSSISVEHRKIIASLIAKSYDIEIKNAKEVSTYNY